MGLSTVTRAKVWRAVNTPGGPVFEWARKMSIDVQDRATAKSPVNDPGNALHRGGVVGTYKKGWRRRTYANQHGSGALIHNDVEHAIIVEEGRRISTRFQLFSWTKYPGQLVYVNGRGFLRNLGKGWAADPDDIAFIGRKTAARQGEHVLAKAVKWATARNV